MRGRQWTAADVEYVLANRDTLNLAGVGRRLGRTAASVSSMLRRRGHARPYRPRASWEPRLRELHAAGLWDCALAREMGCSRDSARRRRLALGLPANPYPRAGRPRGGRA